MYEIAQENKRLSEPLQNALKEVESLRHQLQNYEKDKMSLEQTKARLRESNKQLRNLEWEYEVFTQKFTQVKRERDELYDSFEQSIYSMQQKSGLKNMLLEKKLETVHAELEKKDVQLSEVIRATGMADGGAAGDGSAAPTTSGDGQAGSHDMVSQLTRRLDEVLTQKNDDIKALQYDVAKVSKAHNDLIRVYEAKLSEFGIPVEELGFRPLVTSTTTGPAGLVAATS